MKAPPLGAVRKIVAAEAEYRRTKRKERIVLIATAAIALVLAVLAIALAPLARPDCAMALFDPQMHGKAYVCPPDIPPGADG